MSRPAVSVVMPFAGDAAAARAALAALLGIERRPGDELILADNSGTGVAAGEVKLARAAVERSPAHARNVGAASARVEWILFLDADCRPSAGLLDAYFSAPVPPDAGALAGEVVPSPDAATLAGSYGVARGFLSQEAHLAHPYRPRAVAANLLVRRAAFEAVGGFQEGVRAAEDTDFCWRLQQAGWRLELRRDAWVAHSYRGTVRELRRQWRGYAAGRAWLARRYEGFAPEPAVRRALARLAGGSGSPAVRAHACASRPAGRLADRCHLALDLLLAVEELAGLTLSNRPERLPRLGPAEVVLVASRFPTGAALADQAPGARVEAATRPELVAVATRPELPVDYREDDGLAVRALALAVLMARRPLDCVADLARRLPGEPGLAALAPAVLRLARDRGARVQALGGEDARATARRLATLAGRALDAGEGERLRPGDERS